MTDTTAATGAALAADAAPALAARRATLGYGDRVISTDLDLELAGGEVTAIIGPNGCGKSTLLRALGRLLRPRSGRIELGGRDLAAIPAREAAREIAFLTQDAAAPAGIRVRELVARGRYPHQTFLSQASDADLAAIAWALEIVGLEELAERPVDELSGGQRQRVRIAMTLAQRTPLLLLDEPTTYLDLAHQIELMDLLAVLNRDHGRTIVAVLHDLGQAARYADRLVVMRQGRIVATGAPSEVLDADLIGDVFGLRCRVIPDPETGTPLVIPLAPAARRPA